MPTFPDLFDVLDISTRENSYSRLIGAVLERHPEVCRRFVAAIAGQPITGTPTVHGQRSTGRGNRPDLYIEATTATGKWWVVIENKVLADGDRQQLERYLSDCEKQRQGEEGKKIVGFSLISLALRKSTIHGRWAPLSYADLMDKIDAVDPSHQILDDPVVGLPWAALRERIRHFEAAPPPGDQDALVGWLDQPDEGFVTISERARLLGRQLVPEAAGFEVSCSPYTSSGHQQVLVQVWRRSWDTKHHPGGQGLVENVSVHFEADIPWPFQAREVTCHLHCETAPYLPRSLLMKRGAEASAFLAFSASFTDALHPRLAATGWSPSTRHLQKARISLPLTRTTTIGEFRQTLLTKINAVAASVDAAMLEAGQTHGLSWAVPGDFGR